jgi:hypothetical protein
MRICNAPVEDVLGLEADHAPAAEFAPLDRVLSQIIHASLEGKRVTRLLPSVKPFETVELVETTDRDTDFVVRNFDLATQQRRGAWFLPEDAILTVGWANWPYHADRYERFASGVAHGERGKVRFDGAPSAVFVWAVLEPVFEVLYRPFILRGPSPLGGSRDQQRQTWAEVHDAYRALGMALDRSLTGIAFAQGWAKRRAPEQLLLRRALREAIREAAPPDVGARYRVWITQQLVQKYYAKATRGTATMRKVLTKPLQRSLTAIFGGDWLSFLAYVGEAPNPGEQISRTLPEPRLYVGAATRAKEVAAEHGIATEEVERMLSTLWSSSDAVSPVHRRVAVLREYWDHFEAAHAAQASGMNSLWGFADAEAVRLTGLDKSESGPSWYHPGQYRTRLPAPMIDEIERLWEGLFLPLAPDRIVTSSSPYGGMLDAFGPALRLWHGVGLTTWFLSEGPMSRTDMGGLRAYHSRDLEALAALKTPVDTALFADLIAAEKRLGKPKPYTAGERVTELIPGVQMSTGMNIGSKRSGFEFLRDVVTKHRRSWSAKYLDAYLRARWESEIQGAAREYARHLEVKGKALTGKQFAKVAEAPTNHWFGGDVNSLYAAFGEKVAGPTRRVALLPHNVQSFALRVFYALGGSKTEASSYTYDENEAERARRQSEWDAHSKRKQLAELSVRYAQLREALGRQPTVVEFGRDKFRYLGSVLHADPTLAWSAYAGGIDQLLPL